MTANRATRTVFTLAFAALASFAIWLTLTRFRAVNAEAARNAGEVQSLKESVRALAETKARPTVIFEAPRPERAAVSVPSMPEATTNSAPTAASDPLAGLDSDEKQYRLGVINDAQTKLVSSVIEREPSDPSWSKSAAESLRKAYDGDEFAGVDITADCKSTLCKVSLSSKDPMQGELAIHKMIQKQPWPTNGFAHFDRETQQGFVYLAREGSELPRVDPASLTY